MLKDYATSLTCKDQLTSHECSVSLWKQLFNVFIGKLITESFLNVWCGVKKMWSFTSQGRSNGKVILKLHYGKCRIPLFFFTFFLICLLWVLLFKVTSFQSWYKVNLVYVLPTVAEQCGNTAIFKSREVTGKGGFVVLVDPRDLQSRGRWGLSCLGYQALGRPAITLSLSQPEEQRRLQIQKLMRSRSQSSLVSKCPGSSPCLIISFYSNLHHNHFLSYPLFCYNPTIHCSMVLI